MEEPKVKLVRELCVRCRNDAYRKHKEAESGMWDTNQFCEAMWPKGEGPYRELYKGCPTAEQFCFVWCPGPVVSDWVNDYFIPKLYDILVDNLSGSERDLVKMGLDNFLAKIELGRYEDKGKGKTPEWEALFREVLKHDYQRITVHYKTIDVKIYCYENPPIWCPHEKEHKEWRE